MFDINLPKETSSKYVYIWFIDKKILYYHFLGKCWAMGGQFMCYFMNNRCLHKWIWEQLLEIHMLCARKGCGIGLVTNYLEDHITFVILLKWAIVYEIIFKHFKSWAQTLKCLDWIFKIILNIKGNLNQFAKIILWLNYTWFDAISFNPLIFQKISCFEFEFYYWIAWVITSK